MEISRSRTLLSHSLYFHHSSKLNYKVKLVLVYIFLGGFGLNLSAPNRGTGHFGSSNNGFIVFVSPQPLLNSLAVFFRARPPWPTTFPLIKTNNNSPPSNSADLSTLSSSSNNFQVFPNSIPSHSQGLPIPSPLLASGKSQQGILVAHPVPSKLIAFNHGHGLTRKRIPGRKPIGSFSIHMPSLPSPVPIQSQGTSSEPISGSGLIYEYHNSPTPDLPVDPLLTSPSSLSNTFRYPDPPSVPRLQSMTGNSNEKIRVPENINNSPGHIVYSSKWIPTDTTSSSSRSISREITTSSTPPEIIHTRIPESPQHSPSPSKPPKAFKSKSTKSLTFRPSPQVDNPYNYGSGYGSSWSSSYRNKDLFSTEETKHATIQTSFNSNDAKSPPKYESGFQPISYHQYAASYGTTASYDKYTNSFTQWQAQKPKKYRKQSSTTTTTTMPLTMAATKKPKTYKKEHKNYKIIQGSASKTVITTEASIEQSNSKSQENHHASTSSSELIEDWVKPSKIIKKGKVSSRNSELFNSSKEKTKQKLTTSKSNRNTNKFPVYQKNKSHPNLKVRPMKCDKYHRYGFCPVTPHYPTLQVEKIVARCSALLSHLISPLPKTDVHFDIVVTRNESSSSGSSEDNIYIPNSSKSRRSGVGTGTGSSSRKWSWKTYRGKPLCNTEEIRILPGWAKNENGEWLVILQTDVWKQEAQVSICTVRKSPPPEQPESCNGIFCQSPVESTPHHTKCVQRFTAQRLAVLDPENYDRCPVIRSVFLPSACVCLSDEATGEESSKSLSADDTEAQQSNIHNYRLGNSRSIEFDDRNTKNVDEVGDQFQISSSNKIPVVKVMNSTTTNSPKKHKQSLNSSNFNPRDSGEDTLTTTMIVTRKFTTNESSSED